MCWVVVTVTGGWRKLHNEKPYNLLCYSPHLIRTIVSRKMEWIECVAQMKERRKSNTEFILGDDLGV